MKGRGVEGWDERVVDWAYIDGGKLNREKSVGGCGEGSMSHVIV